MAALHGNRMKLIGSGTYNVTASTTANPTHRPRGIGRFQTKEVPQARLHVRTDPTWRGVVKDDWRKWDLWLNDERSGNWNMENLPWK